MRTAVAIGGRAQRKANGIGFRAYLAEFINRGHVVEATKRGISVLAPGF